MATDNGKFVPNPYTSAKMTNMILIDLPVGVGFSYSKRRHFRYNQGNGFRITYGLHFHEEPGHKRAPAYCAWVRCQPHFVFHRSFPTQKSRCSATRTKIPQRMKTAKFYTSRRIIPLQNPGRDVTNVEKPRCDWLDIVCYPVKECVFLERGDFQRSLGANPGVSVNFSFISIPVLESFVRTHDQLSLTTHLHLENLLERGIRVLFHNGVCHWLGVFRRPLAPDRSGSSDFSVAQKRDRVVDASVAEWLKNSLLLTFVIVEGAGHHGEVNNFMSSCNGGLRTSPFKSSQYNQDPPHGGDSGDNRQGNHEMNGLGDEEKPKICAIRARCISL